ncbi:hypothetical protein LTS18_003204 [Coniosporium uncinatum]|uniref:Uncharacterized protein n=1 Tax=Coniosporium uncinatum TaxID=93489 RepID=A0ACC3DTR9_9PEZI|nr:hypothetical protein LTS18_003204 [Coniosporium uncinatum]
MHLTTSLPLFLLLLIAPVTLALTPCTTSTAITLSVGSGTDAENSGSAVDSCSAKCGNDSACLSTCLSLAGQGECAAVGCDGESNLIDDGTGVVDDGDLIKRGIRMRVRRGKGRLGLGAGSGSGSLGLARRQGYNCEDTELCAVSGNGVLMCLDGTSGDYTDENGGSGNAYDGSYTAGSGSNNSSSDDSSSDDSSPSSASDDSDAASSSTTADADSSSATADATSADATGGGATAYDSESASTTSSTAPRTSAASSAASLATASGKPTGGNVVVSTGAAGKLSAGIFAAVGVAGPLFVMVV